MKKVFALLITIALCAAALLPVLETFPAPSEARGRRSKNGICYLQWRAKISRTRLCKETSDHLLAQHQD